jgi:hypothetical protein
MEQTKNGLMKMMVMKNLITECSTATCVPIQIGKVQDSVELPRSIGYSFLLLILKLVVCILLRVLGQVQGFRLTQHCFEYFIQ